MTRSLKASIMLGFVDVFVKKDSDDELKSFKWECANVVNCSWILGSLDPYMDLSTLVLLILSLLRKVISSDEWVSYIFI